MANNSTSQPYARQEDLFSVPNRLDTSARTRMHNRIRNMAVAPATGSNTIFHPAQHLTAP